MSFEFLGTDLTTEQGRSELFEVVSFMHEIDSSHLDELNLNEVVEQWANADGDKTEIKEFLEACWEHESPDIRITAIQYAEFGIEDNPNHLIDQFSRGLADGNEKVQRSAKGVMHDFLHGENEGVIKIIGLSRLASIIRLYKSTGFEEELASKRQTTSTE